MKIHTYITTCLLVFSYSPLYAESPKLSIDYQRCIAKAEAVDPKVSACMSDEYIRQNKKLNEAYKALMAKITPERKKALQDIQRLWVKYTETNCSFYLGPDSGTLHRQAAYECNIDARAYRSEELEYLAQHYQRSRQNLTLLPTDQHSRVGKALPTLPTRSLAHIRLGTTVGSKLPTLLRYEPGLSTHRALFA